MRTAVQRASIGGLLAILLCACNSGGAGIQGVPSPAAVLLPVSAAVNVDVGAQPVSVAIPVAAQITGSVTFPAVRTPTTIEVRASATAPSANLAVQRVRRTQTTSGLLSVYDYVIITPRATCVLPSLPALHFTFPPANPIAGKTLFYGISDPDGAGGIVSFDTEGPGKISGQDVTFAPVPTPLTLLAGQRYVFVLYSVLPTVGEAAKIYVVTSGGLNSSGGLVTYLADGTPTVPKIADVFDAHDASQSTIENVAVDPSGKIYVTNEFYCNPGPTCPRSTVTSYTAGGVPSTPTIELPAADGQNAFPGGIAVDASGKIYVVTLQTGLATYRPDGSQTTPTIAGQSEFALGVAVDRAGKIYLTFTDGSIRTFRPDGSPATPTITDLHNPTNAAFDAAGNIYVGDSDYSVPNSGTIHTYTPDGSPSGLIITHVDKPTSIAIDAAGKIYVASMSDSSVTIYDADGSLSPISIYGVLEPLGLAVH